MDSCSSQNQPFCDLHNMKVSSCGNARHNRRSFPTKMGPRTFRLLKCDVVCKVKACTRVALWKYKRKIYFSTNMLLLFKGRLSFNFVLSRLSSCAALYLRVCFKLYHIKLPSRISLRRKVNGSMQAVNVQRYSGR